VVDVLDGEVELVLVAFRLAAIFVPAIGQHAADHDLVLVEERHHAVVHQLGGGERRLPVVELGEDDLGVGVDRLGRWLCAGRNAVRPLDRPQSQRSLHRSPI
jgi:hypothetical protein